MKKNENMMNNSNKELNEMRDILVNAVRNVRPNTDGYVTNGVLRVVLGLSKGQAAELRREGLINMLKARINQADGEFKRPTDEVREAAIVYKSRFKTAIAASRIAKNPYTEDKQRLWFKATNYYGNRRIVKNEKLIKFLQPGMGSTTVEELIVNLEKLGFITKARYTRTEVFLWFVNDLTLKYESFEKQVKERTERLLSGTATVEQLNAEPWVADEPRELLDDASTTPATEKKTASAPTKEATETVAHAPSNVGDAGAALTNEEPI